MKWYYAEGSRQAGPIDDSQFRAFVASGKINAETLVWHDGMPNWTLYGRVKEQQTKRSSLKLAQEAATRIIPRPAMSAQALSLAPTSPTTGVTPTPSLAAGIARPEFMSYGGFWLRLVAKVLDSIILGILSSGFGFASGIVAAATLKTENPAIILGSQIAFLVVSTIVLLGYTPFFHGKFGATPGKMAVKLRVVRPDGKAISCGMAFGRFLAELLSSMLLCIGYLMAAFDSEKRALHDRLAGTRVIRI